MIDIRMGNVGGCGGDVADSAKGECFTVKLTSPSECFTTKLTSPPECFFIRCEDDTTDVEIVPPELSVRGFTKIRDVVEHGLGYLIVLAWYEINNVSTPVVAKLLFTPNSDGDILRISGMYGYKRLDSFYPPIDINDSSLETFDPTTAVKNIAIKTSTEVIYLDGLLLELEARVTDPLALTHVFSNTDDAYWTGLQSDVSSTIPPPVNILPHRYAYIKTDQSWINYLLHDYTIAEAIAKQHELVSQSFVLSTNDFTSFNLYGGNNPPDGHAVYASMIWHTSGSSLPSVSDGKFNTITRSIYDLSESLIDGGNAFTTNAKSTVNPYTESVDPYRPQYMNYETGGITFTPEPIATELTDIFYNIRDKLAFGNGFLAVGENIGKSSAGYLEVRSGKYQPNPPSGVIITENQLWLDIYVSTYSYVSNIQEADVYLVPFTTDTRKVQVNEKWISMGTVAISADFTNYVDDMPETNNIVGAVVGGRCVVPIDPPVQRDDGSWLLLNQEYIFEDNEKPVSIFE